MGHIGTIIKAVTDLPARLFGGNAQKVEVSGLDYTIHLDYEKLPTTDAPSEPEGKWIAVWDEVANTYKRVEFLDFPQGPEGPPGSIESEPVDDLVYGRRNSVWTRAVAVAGDTMTGTLEIKPTAGTLNQAINIEQTGPFTGTLTGVRNFDYNYILVTDPTRQENTYDIANALRVLMYTGGPGFGSKTAGQFVVNHETAGVTGGDLVGIVGMCQGDSPNGGTDTGAGAAGAMFGGSFVGRLGAGAINYHTVSGGEVNAGIEPGGSAKCRFGWSIIGIGAGGPADTIYDCALELGSAGQPWKTGIMLSNLHGTTPMMTAGSFIADDGGPATIYHFINVPNYTINGNIFEFKNFHVAGSGWVGIGAPLFTHPGFGNVNVGVTIDPLGLISVSRASGVALLANTNTDGGLMQFSRSGVGVGSISVTAAATNYNTVSDERLKEDLQTFDAGRIIDQTEVYDFRWKDVGERAYGVLAQQAVEVYPTAVTHDEKEDWWGIDYSKYVPILLQELKALRARVAELEGATKPIPTRRS